MTPIYSPYRRRRPRGQVMIRPLSPKRSLLLFAWEAIWLAAVMAAAASLFK